MLSIDMQKHRIASLSGFIGECVSKCISDNEGESYHSQILEAIDGRR